MSISIASPTLELPLVPDLPDLVIRAFRGAPDYPVIAEIINAENRANNEEYLSTPEEVAQNYQHITNCDLNTDMLFAEVAGQPAAYCRVEWWQEENGPRIYGYVLRCKPAYRAADLDRALLRWAEARLRVIAASHEFSGERFLQQWANQELVHTIGLLTSEGYQPVRYSFEMLRPTLDDIPDFELPPGIELRPATPEQFRAIWDADVEAFRDHWGATVTTEADYQRFLNFPHRDESLWRIAWAGDQVAGQVKSFINHKENETFNRKRGYTEFISVSRPWRRQGLARALLALSLHALKERGMTEAELGVDAENPTGALRVYLACGFEVKKRHATYRKPLW